jgi:hypothetical protein
LVVVGRGWFIFGQAKFNPDLNVVFLMGSRLLLKMGSSRSGDPVVEYDKA